MLRSLWFQQTVDSPYVWIALRFLVGAAFVANGAAKMVYQVSPVLLELGAPRTTASSLASSKRVVERDDQYQYK